MTPACTTLLFTGLYLMLTFTVAPGTRWVECRAFRSYMRPAEECPPLGVCARAMREPVVCEAGPGWAATVCPGPGEIVSMEVRACNSAGCSDWIGG